MLFVFIEFSFYLVVCVEEAMSGDSDEQVYLPHFGAETVLYFDYYWVQRPIHRKAARPSINPSKFILISSPMRQIIEMVCFANVNLLMAKHESEIQSRASGKD